MTVRKTPENPFNPQTAEILKRIDALLKKEDVDGARAEVQRAKAVDPKNMYVHAYYERVQLLIHDRTRKTEADEVHEKDEKMSPRAQSAIEPTVSEELKVAAEKAVAERKRRLEAEVQRKLEAETLRKPAAAGPAHSAELLEYNKALFEAWELGIPGPELAARLKELRLSLHITPEEHEDLETSVQRESYIRAFKKLWMSTGTASDGVSTITNLHRTYGIVPGKFDGLDLTLLQEIRIPKTRPQLVVIDDDAQMLEVIEVLLRDQGFDVRPFITSDEAFRFLLHSTPDLILADINLESSTMGGFAFFQKLQEIPRLASLPFIFVSGLTDEVVIRTGKSLGADDYITKPFVSETLISIIRGKLRRYSELRSFRAN